MQKLTERESSTINIMKALAVLSVIAAHVTTFRDVNFFSKITSSLWTIFGEVGVVVFFVIGGFLYHRNANDSKEFWRKKVFRIIIPWFVCSTATYILAIAAGESDLQYIKWILGSGTWYYYISVYTLFLFIFNWFYKNDVILWFFIGLQTLLLTLQTFGVTTTLSFGFLTDYLNPFHWAGYFSLGILAKKYRFDLILRKRKAMVGIAGLTAAFSLCFLCYQEIFTYFHVVSSIFCVSALTIIATVSYKIADRKIARYIGKIGTYSYCIYLLHMQIVQFVVSRMTDGVFKTVFAPFIGLFVMTTIILLGLFICKKLPFGDKIKMIFGL